MSITTKTGDDGTTALYGGKRVEKSDPRIEACGAIDELTSWLGLIVATMSHQEHREILIQTQKHLYAIMAIIATSPGELSKVSQHLKTIEKVIVELELALPKLTQFILPGGPELSAKLHIARAVARRAERVSVLILHNYMEYDKKAVPISLRYLNRLSDLLFLLARHYNTEVVLAKTLQKTIPPKSH